MVEIMNDLQYFDQMLEMIPSKFYFPQEVDESQWKNKFMKV